MTAKWILISAVGGVLLVSVTGGVIYGASNATARPNSSHVSHMNPQPPKARTLSPHQSRGTAAPRQAERAVFPTPGPGANSVCVERTYGQCGQELPFHTTALNGRFSTE